MEGKENKEDTTCPTCIKCNGTTWYMYDGNHSTRCKYCCKHEDGWWELSKYYHGYKEGKGRNNMCCSNGCGMMQRDLIKEMEANFISSVHFHRKMYKEGLADRRYLVLCYRNLVYALHKLKLNL